MAWTQSQLAAAFNALSPAPATLSAGCSALNAQTVALTQPAADVGLGDIQGVLLLNGDWLKVQKEAGGTPTGATTDPVTVAQLAVQLVQSKALTVGAANWAQFLQMLQVLQADNIITAASYNAIAALAVMSVPAWQPAVGVGQLQSCQEAGLISNTIPVI